mmetsp:Transcript_8442/g.23820  ORF Transcript_8442/g.23820 Transcript_8442/m.23820 type:complete len:539 (+) Transcript_8442:241-1857(+)
MASGRGILLLVTLVGVLWSEWCVGIVQIDPETRQFRDESGRTLIFHGVNAVYKVFPWQPSTGAFDPETSLNAEDAANLASWGFNVVRLGVMWPGVEPSRGQYNDTYLANMRGIADTLAAHGIYTIVDMHQDVINRQFCGEGVPDWAIEYGRPVKPFPEPVFGAYPTDGDNYPPLDTCLSKSFATYYPSDASCAAFQALYDNVNGMQDAYVGFWRKVADTFKDHEYVLGYELINEPWAGDIYTNKSLLLPGRADLINLEPMYARVNDAIREIDDEHIIFFDRSLSDSVSPVVGFTQGPGGPAYNDRQVFSYHVYCAPTDEEGDPTRLLLCNAIDVASLLTQLKEAKRLNVASMLTEFGAVGGDATALANMGFLLQLVEARFQSWVYWQFKFYEDLTTAGPGESFYQEDGSLDTSKVRTLSRTYARVIGGVPLQNKFNPVTASYELTYEPMPGADTEIFLSNAFYYPKGFTMNASPQEGVVFSTDTNPTMSYSIVTVSVSTDFPPNSNLTVSIKAKLRPGLSATSDPYEFNGIKQYFGFP